MTNVLPFPSEPTNPVRLSRGSAARLARRVDGAVERSARPGVDRVADCVLAMEAGCHAEPCILPARNLSRQGRVAVVLPGYDRLLTSDEARAVAHRLRADNAFAGAWSVALRLDAAADQAERRNPGDGPLDPGRRPGGSGGRFLILALLIAAVVAGLIAFA